MLAKLTAKNQITLPKSVTQAIGPVEYEQGPAGEKRRSPPWTTSLRTQQPGLQAFSLPLTVTSVIPEFQGILAELGEEMAEL